MMTMKQQQQQQQQQQQDAEEQIQDDRHSRPESQQLRRRFSREEDGSSSKEVLKFLERRGSSLSELQLECVGDTIQDDDVAEMERILINHHRAISLTHLELPNNGLTAAAGTPLASIITAQHETLTVLSLADNPLTPAGLIPLVQALSAESPSPSKLIELDLSDTKLGSRGATVVASILKASTSIQKLNLSRNEIGTKGMRVLAPSIVAHIMLRHINLSYNNIKPRGTTFLAQALEDFHNINTNNNFDEGTKIHKERGLRSLDLTCNRIGAQGTQALCDVLKFDRSIKNLIVGKNDLLPEGGAYIAYLLKSNHTLRYLDIHDNQIGPDAASLLVEQLTEDNRTLERLDLSYNNIGRRGVQDLADTLMKNESLLECLLDGNKIESDEAALLANALNYNFTLTTLSLKHNKIDDNGAFAIANALGKPWCKVRVDCTDNQIGPAGQRSLEHAPQLNRNRKFWLDELLKGIYKGLVTNIDMQSRNVADEEIMLLSRALEQRWSPNKGGSSSSFNVDSTSSLALASMADCHEIPVRTMHVNGKNLTSRSLVPLIRATLPSPSNVLRLYLQGCKTCDLNLMETISRCTSLSTSLEVFSLTECHLGEDDGVVFARGLQQNMTLRRLNLDRNNIKDRGMKALIQAVSSHPTLTSLSVASNGITDASMEMSEGLMGLKEINLDDSNITDRGALDFCRFLMGITGDHEMNKCKIEILSFRGNKISKRGGETIKTFLKDKATVNY